MARERTAHLLLISNPDKLTLIKIREGHCRLLGRASGVDTTIPLQAGGLRLIPAEALDSLHENVRQLAERPQPRALDVESFKRQDDALVDDSSISQHHVMFYNSGGELSLVDMGSKNGTQVNGQRVMATALETGDIITLGKTRLRVE